MNLSFTADSVRKLLAITLTTVAVIQSWKLFLHYSQGSPWDFEAYYISTLAWIKGLNPYDVISANHIRSELNLAPSDLKYPYHPFTLFLFDAFASRPLSQAIFIWRIVNYTAIALIVLLWLQTSSLEKVRLDLATLIFGFGFPIAMCYVDGNPAPLETLAIWGGLMLYFAGRQYLGLATISLAILLKLIPIGYFVILFAISSRTDRHKIIIASGLTIAALASSLWLMPLEFAGFLQFIASANSHTYLNSSSLNILLTWINPEPRSHISALVYFIWSIWVVLTLLFSARLIRGIRNEDRFIRTLAVVAVYALTTPRWGTYSFLQLLPLGAYVGYRYPLMIIPNGLIFMFMRFNGELHVTLWPYFAFVVVLGNALLLFRQISRSSASGARA